MALTLKKFVSETHLDESLVRSVVRQVGGWGSFTEMAEDVSNHGADGGFSGFVYYSDTVPFAKRNLDALLRTCRDMARDFGDGDEYQLIAGFNCLKMTVGEVAGAIHNPKHEDRTTVLNALAWFALEEVSRSYVDAMERVS
jgi:hypothetical protein